MALVAALRVPVVAVGLPVLRGGSRARAAAPCRGGCSSGGVVPAEHAVGILCRIWTWFDQHTDEGVTNKFGTKMVGKYTRTAVTDERDEVVTMVNDTGILITPFLEAMQEVEWIRLTKEGFWALTNWEEHNGKTAKSRATNQKSKAKSRATKESMTNVTQEGDELRTREEKRREEKNREESVVVLDSEDEKSTHTPPANANEPINVYEVIEHAKQHFKGKGVTKANCQEFYDKWSASGWLDSNLKHFNWKMKFGYFVEGDDKPNKTGSKKEVFTPMTTDHFKAPKMTEVELDKSYNGIQALTMPKRG